MSQSDISNAMVKVEQDQREVVANIVTIEPQREKCKMRSLIDCLKLLGRAELKSWCREQDLNLHAFYGTGS